MKLIRALNLLLTGGAGFIGSEFLRSALRNKYSEFNLIFNKIVLVDALTYAGNLNNLEETRNDSRLEFIQADIQDEDLMIKLTKDIDLVINFAAETHVDRSIINPRTFVDSNIRGVFSLLEAARANQVKMFVQISTDEVYGSVEKGSSIETDNLAPNSPYAASKASADLLVRSYSKTFGLKTLITRTCNNYGPFQNREKLIPVLIHAAKNNLNLPIYGNGLNEREWIHVEDNCRAIAFLISENFPHQIVNIGSGLNKNNLEIAKNILELCPASKSKIEFVQDRKGHDFRYSLDCSLLLELGFKLIKNFDIEFQKTINWY